jgi:hypothetical protein
MSSMSNPSFVACASTLQPFTSRSTVLCVSPICVATVASSASSSSQWAAYLAFANASHLNGPLMCLNAMNARAWSRLETHRTRTSSGRSGIGPSILWPTRLRVASSVSRRSAAKRLLPSRTMLLLRSTINGSKSTQPAACIDVTSSLTSAFAMRYFRTSSCLENLRSAARGFSGSKSSVVCITNPSDAVDALAIIAVQCYGSWSRVPRRRSIARLGLLWMPTPAKNLLFLQGQPNRILTR